MHSLWRGEDILEPPPPPPPPRACALLTSKPCDGSQSLRHETKTDTSFTPQKSTENKKKRSGGGGGGVNPVHGASPHRKCRYSQIFTPINIKKL